MDNKIDVALLVGVSLVACAFAMPAMAQQQPSPQPVQGAGLEDIVVTARRSAERLQEAPISITALLSDQLERSNVQQLEAVTRMVANVSIKPQPGFLTGNTAMIRGIGTSEPLLSVDTPVGVYIDGVYIGRNNASNLELMDLERIEVLRGPQGTLFGRNTTGGAISMVTKAPTSDFGIEQKVTVASFSEIGSRTRLNTGELGHSGITATVSYLHRHRDGYYENPYASGSRSWGAGNTDSVWAKVRGQWGAFSIDYSLDWTDARGTATNIQTEYLSPLAAQYFGSTTGNPYLSQVRPGYNENYGVAARPTQRVKIVGHALTAHMILPMRCL